MSKPSLEKLNGDSLQEFFRELDRQEIHFSLIAKSGRETPLEIRSISKNPLIRRILLDLHSPIFETADIYTEIIVKNHQGKLYAVRSFGDPVHAIAKDRIQLDYEFRIHPDEIFPE